MKRSGPTGVVSQQSDGGNGDGVLLLARDKGRGERIWEDSVRKGEDMYRGARGLWLKIMLGIGCDGGRGSAMATTKESSLNHTKKTTFVIYCCLIHKKNCFTMPTFKDFKHFVYTSHLSYTHKNMWKRKLSLDSVEKLLYSGCFHRRDKYHPAESWRLFVFHTTAKNCENCLFLTIIQTHMNSLHQL